MIKRALIKRAIFAFIFTLAIAPALAQQAEVSAMNLAEPQQGEAREEEMYRAGTDAMNQGQWQAAYDNFNQVARGSGKRADGALYWKAYAQNKLTRRAAALQTIAELGKQYPKSSWLKEARALELEIRGNSGQQVTPAAEDDEDLKLLAINSLMNTDEERAIPLLQKVLSGGSSQQLKERALFVLAQSDSPRAHELVGQIAHGSAGPDLQMKAIHNLGINSNAANRKTLGEIYASSNNLEVKKTVLHSLGIGGAREQVFAIARTEKNPDLREAAIHGLAISGAREELRQLYKEATDAETKSILLHSAIISGDQQLLVTAIQTETDAKVKREAIHNLGITGGPEVSPTLINIYKTDKNRDIREAAVQALFVHGDAHSLVELARQESDPELRKALVQKLSIMGNKEANDYLIQLLEK